MGSSTPAFSAPGVARFRAAAERARAPRVCSHVTPTAALGRALVVGANRGLGLAVAGALSAAGAEATTGSLRPSADDAALAALDGVESLRLNVRDRDAVLAALAELRPDVVFSCIGGSPTDDDRPDYTGNQNLIDAAEACGAKRFVLVSALGASESEFSVPFQVAEQMRPLMMDKSRAELYLKEADLSWTIVRPVPLEDEEARGSGFLSEGITCYGTITRADLADLLVKAADAESAKGKTFTAIDRQRVLLTHPYVRPLEFWEPMPVEEYVL